jgi:hypothetical protein
VNLPVAFRGAATEHARRGKEEMANDVYRRTTAGYRAFLAHQEHKLSFEQRHILRVLEEETNLGMLGLLLPYHTENLRSLLGELSAKGFIELVSPAG